MNKIDKLFQDKKNVLSIYFTCGFPKLEDTANVLLALQNSGVDMVEVGFPFSDPLADGPVIQDSSTKAIDNGITAEKIFEQIEAVKDQITMPLVAMGYLNTVMQYGVEKFLKRWSALGGSGMILPDLPPLEYEQHYKHLFEQYNIYPVFLITPQTSDARIKYLDAMSKGFVYMVSTSSTTGAKSSFGTDTESYFKRIAELNLKNPTVVGFGISNKATFDAACKYANGAIIGSAFIRAIADGYSEEKVRSFVEMVKG